MTTHVAIATTQGPVFIQEITQEEPGVSPIVCLNGTSKQLAVSTAYGDFVKKGSGLIERDFGSASWRMDLSGAIDAGESWQLTFSVSDISDASNSDFWCPSTTAIGATPDRGTPGSDNDSCL